MMSVREEKSLEFEQVICDILHTVTMSAKYSGKYGPYETDGYYPCDVWLKTHVCSCKNENGSHVKEIHTLYSKLLLNNSRDFFYNQLYSTVKVFYKKLVDRNSGDYSGIEKMMETIIDSYQIPPHGKIK